MASWGGRVLVSAGHCLYVGPAGDTRPHRHHALQLVVGLEASFDAQLGPPTPESFEAVLIAADVEHRIDGQGRPLAIYYVDRSSLEGRAWTDSLGGERARALGADAEKLRRVIQAALDRPPGTILAFARARLTDALGIRFPAPSVADPAVEKAVSLLGQSLANPIPVPQLARRAGLRQRDLSARFRGETGLTIRRYVLWIRLKAAVSALGEGRTLTEAAHAAGFSDAAHLSRTFVEMFGVSPSESVAASALEVIEQA